MNTADILKNQKFFSTGHHQRAFGDYGMAVSATKESSIAGANVLKSGGNAMDALTAMQFALAVSEPFNTGLGASGFILYYEAATGKTEVIHGHSKAPARAIHNQFVDEHNDVLPFLKRSTPGTAVAIPGIVKAFFEASQTYGSQSWSKLLEPAISLAEGGMKVNELWEFGFRVYGNRLGPAAKAFFYPNGQPLKTGDTIKNHELAKALRLIQQEGPDVFYKGEIAEAMVDAICSLGGYVTKEDLANYTVHYQPTIKGHYKGFDIIVPSPPNAGGVGLLYMLKLLEKLNIEQYDVHSPEKYYLLAETLRIMTADKLAYMGDPDFYDIPIEGLLSDGYIEERLKLYNFAGRNPDVSFGNPWAYQSYGDPVPLAAQPFEIGSETTHFAAVDSAGNIAACTSSLEHYFGSGIMVPGYGFLLNNDMTDFDPSIGGINSVEPNKYPVSMKTPTIVMKDNQPFLTLGSPGGPTIVASVLQTLIHVLDYRMDLKDAIEEPRIYNGTGPLLWWENGLSEEARQALEKMNFQPDDKPFSMGNVQAILFDQENGLYYGASDSSRPGIPAGVNKEDVLG